MVWSNLVNSYKTPKSQPFTGPASYWAGIIDAARNASGTQTIDVGGAKVAATPTSSGPMPPGYRATTGDALGAVMPSPGDTPRSVSTDPGPLNPWGSAPASGPYVTASTLDDPVVAGPPEELSLGAQAKLASDQPYDNPYANVQNPFTGIENPYTGIQNPYSNIQNPYADLPGQLPGPRTDDIGATYGDVDYASNTDQIDQLYNDLLAQHESDWSNTQQILADEAARGQRFAAAGNLGQSYGGSFLGGQRQASAVAQENLARALAAHQQRGLDLGTERARMMSEAEQRAADRKYGTDMAKAAATISDLFNVDQRTATAMLAGAGAKLDIDKSAAAAGLGLDTTKAAADLDIANRAAAAGLDIGMAGAGGEHDIFKTKLTGLYDVQAAAAMSGDVGGVPSTDPRMTGTATNPETGGVFTEQYPDIEIPGDLSSYARSLPNVFNLGSYGELDLNPDVQNWIAKYIQDNGKPPTEAEVKAGSRLVAMEKLIQFWRDRGYSEEEAKEGAGMYLVHQYYGGR